MRLKHDIKHLAIILDGNRRWAKRQGLAPWRGYKKGAEILEKLLGWVSELGIKELTLYVLSTENLSRSRQELDKLFWLFDSWHKKIKEDERIFKNKIKIRYIGDLSLLPKKICRQCKEIEKITAKHNKLVVNLCMAYGGRLELVYAVNKLKNKKGRISEKDITNTLWLSSEPDLIIRTGGAMRLSNFLTWQGVYSELFFIKKFWPDFKKADIISVIKEFNIRHRRFGK